MIGVYMAEWRMIMSGGGRGDVPLDGRITSAFEMMWQHIMTTSTTEQHLLG
jgi:hypothetical protein